MYVYANIQAAAQLGFLKHDIVHGYYCIVYWKSRNIRCGYNFVIFVGSISQRNEIHDEFFNPSVHKYRVDMWTILEITIWRN